MRNVRMWASLVVLSVFALLVLRYFPGNWINDDYHLNSIVGYAVVAGIFYSAVYLMGLPSLKYFGLPKLRLKAVVAVIICFTGPVMQIVDSGLKYKSWLDLVSGIGFLLMLGFGEEMLSRGFTFGVLLRFGRFKALVISSFLFGLLHINVYIPGNLGWDTYYHVFSAFGMGMILCALMMVTRSIWVSVVYHALIDWHIPFTPADDSGSGDFSSSLWENLTGPLFSFAFDLLIVLLLLGINAFRIAPAPWMHRLAIRWKLVEPVGVT